MGRCRGVAGKPAAAARTRDAKHSSSATQNSYISTAPSPGPSPRDMGVHAPAGVYAATGGWAYRWPSSPHPAPDLGDAGKRNARAPGELEVGTGTASPRRRRPRPTYFPAIAPSSPGPLGRWLSGQTIYLGCRPCLVLATGSIADTCATSGSFSYFVTSYIRC